MPVASPANRRHSPAAGRRLVRFFSPHAAWLVVLLWIGLAASQGHAVESSAVHDVTISYRPGAEPNLSVKPDPIKLGLNRPGFVRWQLAPPSREAAASFTVSFPAGSPFADSDAAAAADGTCQLGPLLVDAEVGAYEYEVAVSGTGGETITSRLAAVDLREHTGIPRGYLALIVLVGLLFLVFNYIEKPLTRTYEEHAHHTAAAAPDETSG